jgi:hypothetical protein
MWGAVSDDMKGLPFMLLALTSVFILRSESRGTRVYSLRSQIRKFLFVAFHDSQDYGGGIRTRFHTAFTETRLYCREISGKYALTILLKHKLSRNHERREVEIYAANLTNKPSP